MSDVEVTLRRLGVAPRKVRSVIDVVRGKEVSYAISQLLYLPKRAAEPVRKLLRSGVASAKQKGMTSDKLWIKRIEASEGPSWKRYIPHFRGVVLPQRRTTTHVKVTLSDDPMPKKNKVTKIRSNEVSGQNSYGPQN